MRSIGQSCMQISGKTENGSWYHLGHLGKDVTHGKDI